MNHLCGRPNGAAATTKRCCSCRHHKPLSDFHANRNSRDGRHFRCKDCDRVRRRTANPQRRKQRNYLARYGLTLLELAALIERQEGLCAICGRRLTRPCVDHDHGTGKVRGILCVGCNVRLNALEDKEFAEAGRRYLEEHRQ